ncbi:MAG: 16S rRNA (adenine1518-N6/adenine1519-N6)-dimethyltransferase, partial [Parcubacteria group bacterium Gr01-1014_44]
MAEKIAPEKDELILEVGPGEGILTDILAQKGVDVLAIEKDSRLIPILKDKFKNQKNVTILEDDILKLKIETLTGNWKLKIENYKIVGNIPYYITSHLLRIVLENWPKPKLILFMVQKEVAQRIVAKPPKMSMLSLAVQFYAEAKIVKNVSKNNFRPIPKVDSALIKIIPKQGPEILTKDYKLKTINFFKLARAGFSNKRKQILNSLVNNLKLEKSLI